MTLYRINSGNGELDSKHEDVNVRDLIATQKGVFVEVLKNVIETLQEEEVEHRKKFGGKKLISAFQHTSYAFQKVLEATLSAKSPHAELVRTHIDQILKSVEIFKSELRERDEPDDNMEHVYENINYALQHIKAYFHAPEETHIHSEDTYIFADFAKRQMRELKEVAQEIDEKYSDVLIGAVSIRCLSNNL